MTGKIMPVLGCLPHRIYVEKWLKLQEQHPDEKHFAHPIELDPCITCLNRCECKKTIVRFQK